MFNYVGYPWLTQHWVRQVKEKTYGAISTTDGYGHFDEDQGQMGAHERADGDRAVRGHRRRAGAARSTTSPRRSSTSVTIALDHDYYSGRKFVISTHGDGRVHPARAARRARARQRVVPPRPARRRRLAGPVAGRPAEPAVGRRAVAAVGVASPSTASRSTRPRSRSPARTRARAVRDGRLRRDVHAGRTRR